MASSSESREQRTGNGIFECFVFRMPLHPDHKRRIGKADTLDLTIRRDGLDAQRGSGSIDPLRMERVDHRFAGSGEG